MTSQDSPTTGAPVIDSHLHVWDRSRAPYGWLDSASPALRREFSFDEIAPAMSRHGVDAAVLVQADDHPGDTELMLETAAANPAVVGVVASLPLADPAATAALLERYAFHPLIVGIRSLSHDDPDPDWLLGAEQTRSLELVAETGLTFELVPVELRHLEVTVELARRHPGLRLAIDHLGTPPIGSGDLTAWTAALAEVARIPNLRAKVSGLYARSGPHDEQATDDLHRAVDHAVDSFGPDRLMFGTDWPVALLGGGYDRVVGRLLAVIGELDAPERDAVLGGTARSFYGLDLD